MYNRKTLEWVKEVLKRKTVGVMRSLQGGSSYYSAAKGGHIAHSRLHRLSDVKVIHAHMLEHRNEFQVFEENTLMDMYVKSGSVVDARHVFDNMSKQNVVSWNVMILGYAKQDKGALALEMYSWMYHEGIEPSDRTFVAALMACSSLAALEEAKQGNGEPGKTRCLEKGRVIHEQVVKSGLESHLFVGTTLVDMYVKCGSMEDARHVFDSLPQRNVTSWNTMILGHAQNQEGALALDLYVRMHEDGIILDRRTFVSALKACSSLAALEGATEVVGKFVKAGCLEKGRALHSDLLRCGFELDVFVGTTLLDVYLKCGSMEDARHVFDEMPHRNVVSWAAIIAGHAQAEESEIALQLYAQMQQEGFQPHDRTSVSVLKACSSLALLEVGKQVDSKLVKIGCLEKGRFIHSQVTKSGFESNIFVGTTLVDMYVKCGSMDDARHVFDELPHHDVVSWTAMISGYAEQEESEEVFKLHEQMQDQGLLADHVTFACILRACGNTAALIFGKDLHTQICTVGLETTAIVANTLVDMYAKCGSMVDAHRLLDVLPTRDLVTWNALIAGYAHHGETELVFRLFERMSHEGIQPNEVTFLSILTVCSHVGLVDEGKKYFQAVCKQYGIHLTIEHYTCMIDLLGRAGQVEEAVAMLEKMPFQPDLASWLVILGACRKWKNVEVGRHAFAQALRVGNQNASAYVLMSNMYAYADMWEDSKKIHDNRKNFHASTKKGQSWCFEVGGMLNTCVVANRRQPPKAESYTFNAERNVRMRMTIGRCIMWSVGEARDTDMTSLHPRAQACIIQSVSGLSQGPYYHLLGTVQKGHLVCHEF